MNCTCDPWAASETCPLHGDEEHRREPRRRDYWDRMVLDTTPGVEVDDDGALSYRTETPNPWATMGPVPAPPF